MVSVSSRPKNSISGSAVAADIARLLQSNAGLEPVTPELTAAAEHLRGLGLISHRVMDYVCCAWSEDTDFPYSNRTCTGRLHIKPSLDENANDYRCPECRRVVYPIRHGKRRFQELRARVLPEGVRAYVEKALAENGGAATAVGSVPYVWRVDGGLTGVHVCLADYCDDQRVLSVQWAQQNPTCYVAVNPRAIERFIPVGWVSRVMLADLVSGTTDLAEKVRDLSAADSRHDLPHLATPVYSKAGHRPEITAPPATPADGMFELEVGPRTVSINGVEVVASQATANHAIIRHLVKAFVQDFLAAQAPADYICQTPGDLADAIQKEQKKDAISHDDVRRSINRLQENIEKRLNKAGHAVKRDSVIESSPNSAKEGYRLNPFKVVIRPFRPHRP
jgi:hypothetical protein